MDSEKFWSTTEMNKFLYQQLKAMCEAEGFVLSPRRGKRMVHIAEHYTEVVYPEIVYARTVVHVALFSTASFAYHSYANKDIIPQRSNEYVFLNSYTRLAVDDSTSGKRFFNIEQMKAIWAEVIAPQLNREVFSCLNAFHYDHFLILSDKEKCSDFQYRPSPIDYDAPRFFAMGCGELWAGNLKRSIPLLEEALVRYKKGIAQSRQFGYETALYMLEDYDRVAKLLSVLKENGSNNKKQVLDTLQKVEQAALNKTWGVALSPEGKTVRLKKKELL